MAKRVIRPIRIEGNVAYVPLTRGREAVIDAADVHLIKGYAWRISAARGRFYAVTCLPRNGQKQKSIWMHRTILPPTEGVIVDHIDGDGLNNRRANLRLATVSQSMCNAKMRSDNSSGYRGVAFVRAENKWAAYITVQKKRLSLGRFDTAESAHDAYVAASAKYHGDYGRTS